MLIWMFMINFVFDCMEFRIRKASSPDGTYHAELYYEECQSTPNLVLHLQIWDPNSNSREQISLGPVVTTNLELSWLSPTKLEIIYPDNVSPPRDRFPFEDVWVYFRQKNKQ